MSAESNKVTSAEILREWLYARFGKRLTWKVIHTVTGAITRPYWDHINRIDEAISWLEVPLIDENTSHDELKVRVRVMLDDVRIARSLNPHKDA